MSKSKKTSTTYNEKKTGRWTRFADFDSGELIDVRKVGPRAYQFVRITDMDDACGSDNEGREKYAAELLYVDLSALPVATIQSAVDCCGGNEMLPEDMSIERRGLATAEMCMQYGASAMVWGSNAGNSWDKLLREARQEANSQRDPDALQDALQRPVNALGSTAAEYMVGDFQSAMERGVHAGRKDAGIMAKMYGASDQAIQDSRPADWLPYLLGYMDAMAGRENQHIGAGCDEVAPEYHLGFERGENVRNGKAPAPGWITSSKSGKSHIIEGDSHA